MADITVKFRDGTSHTYTGAPDDVTQVQVLQRIVKEDPSRADSIAGIDGAKPSSFVERLKAFATEGQVGSHGVLSSDLPQLLYGLADSATLGQMAGKLPEPETQDEKDSRAAGRELPLALGPGRASGQPLLKPPNFSGGSWQTGAQTRAAQIARNATPAGSVPPTTAQSILNSPWLKFVAKAAGVGGAADLVNILYKHINP